MARNSVEVVVNENSTVCQRLVLAYCYRNVGGVLTSATRQISGHNKTVGWRKCSLIILGRPLFINTLMETVRCTMLEPQPDLGILVL
jgi:hypothetical protein